MKSNIKFEVHSSNDNVNFLDVNISLHNGELKTKVYEKITNAHLYLNKSSCHPGHVIKNIPKGQFVRIRRICSDLEDYLDHSMQISKYFIKRGYNKNQLEDTIKTVSQISRSDLLSDRKKEIKDPNCIFVCDWHPNLGNIPSILNKHHHIIEHDKELSKKIKEKPIVAFRKIKTIRNHIIRNDIVSRKSKTTHTSKCDDCKICPQINTSTSIRNTIRNINYSIKDGGTCKSKGLIYAATCKKHDLIYIGHTGEKLSDRFSKHRYDIKNRPDNSELASHFHQGHSTDDMEIKILQSGLNSKIQRELYEDKWICKLQTLKPSGLNTETNAYAKELYQCYQRCL